MAKSSPLQEGAAETGLDVMGQGVGFTNMVRRDRLPMSEYGATVWSLAMILYSCLMSQSQRTLALFRVKDCHPFSEEIRRNSGDAASAHA